MTRQTVRKLVLLVLSVAVMAPGAKAQTILYVDDDAGEGNNGQSWLAPLKGFEDALAAARDNPIITEIRVAGGVYIPSAQYEPGVPRTETFQLLDGVAIYGGFAGLADPGDPDTRDLERYTSVLSGDLSGNDVEDLASFFVCFSGQGNPHEAGCEPFDINGDGDVDPEDGNIDENSYHVVTAKDAEPTAIMDGFTITGGHADLPSPSIGNEYHRGGGVYLYGGSPSIVQCFVKHNVAYSGGGVYCSATNAVLSDCSITENRGMLGSGGIYCGYPATTPALIRCTISRNRSFGAGNGGGLGCYGSNPRLRDCEITQNESAEHGGGMLLHLCNAQIANCVVAGNSAISCGGGIWWECDHVDGIQDCVAEDSWIVNSTIGGNQASRGGAVELLHGANPLIGSCTVAQNLASNRGGAMYVESSYPNVTNSIFWANTATQGAEILTVNAAPTVSYCCVQVGYSGDGNLDADPRLRDADGPDDVPGTDDDDLQLRLVSPCIDVGNNMAVPCDVTGDLAGSPRFVDAPDTPDIGQGDSPIVDMGAYEFQRPVVGDLDGDGDVDLSDIKTSLVNFTGPLQ